MKTGTPLQEFSKGLWRDNPVLVQLLGMCPTLAVTTTAVNGLAMALATAFVLIMSSFIISTFRKLIPNAVRIASYIVVIASFVTLAVGVLAASGLRTRRRAISLGILVGVASPLCWGLRILPPADLQPFAGAVSQLSHQPVSDFILHKHGLLPSYTLPPTSGDVTRTSITALLVLLAVALLARAWLCWKEEL